MGNMPLFIVACQCPVSHFKPTPTLNIYRTGIPSKPKLVPEESLFEPERSSPVQFRCRFAWESEKGLLCSGQFVKIL
jgi:hypothetical protein